MIDDYGPYNLPQDVIGGSLPRSTVKTLIQNNSLPGSASYAEETVDEWMDSRGFPPGGFEFSSNKPQAFPLPASAPSALDKQVGGGHYKKMKIQPLAFIHANEIGFAEGSAIKYLCRWRDKNGIQDLEKAKHFIELLIQLETEKGKQDGQVTGL